MTDRVSIALDLESALVAFDLLSRLQENEAHVRTGHPAERHAISLLLASLENQLVAPFKDNYPELLAEARRNLMEKWGALEEP